MTLCPIASDLGCAIAGAVIDNDDFCRAPPLLANAVESPLDQLGPIERWSDDGDIQGG